MNQSYQATVEYADPQDVRDNKLMAVLAYLLFFLPLIVCPQSRFARYHANQGLLIFIITCGTSLITRMFSFVPLLRLVIYLLASLVSLIAVVLMIIGMIHAGKGQMKPLPFIGKFQILH